MGGQLVLLFVGFALTTVVGSVLGFFFQKRSADIQTFQRLQETERGTALNLFEELSTLMDRRIYRMRRLCWLVRRGDRERAKLEEAMNAYAEIVRDWNDRLNRNLAVAQIYFGHEIRNELHASIYKGFAEVGTHLEEAYPDDSVLASRTETELDRLAGAVYDLNVRMIRQVRDVRVGAFLPETGSQAARAAGGAVIGVWDDQRN